MTEARTSAEPVQSSRSMPVTIAGVLANILRRFADISAAAANFFRPSRPESVQGQAENGTVEVEADATASLAAEVDVEADATASLAAGVDIDSAPEVSAVSYFVPDPHEIERRRNVVRIFFNDFWGGVSDKPTAFVERLDLAEDYLNERLAANRESWRIDAKTRRMLGLPPRADSSRSAKQTS